MNSIVQKGFSLIEVLVIMAIIGIMAAITTPVLLSQLPKWHMNGAARDIAGKLMMARLRAIQEHTEFGVSFTMKDVDIEGDVDSYKVVKYDSGSGTWESVGVMGEGYEDIDVSVAACVSSRVEFAANGSADGENGCTPSNKLNIVTIKIISTGVSRKIYLNTFTGNMSVD